MGRKRNDAERNRIQSIAFNLFRASGYNETSFTDIANASGAKRSLVQYYFPKKENLIYIYINKALDLASEMVEGNPFVTDP
ncbi:MAG: TetR/AcrR family transcriptional regulator, partial [Clostridia bacterium]|nr:TetR/AcrR family transcriptional regulator [Clostridia bacterium]